MDTAPWPPETWQWVAWVAGMVVLVGLWIWHAIQVVRERRRP